MGSFNLFLVFIFQGYIQKVNLINCVSGLQNVSGLQKYLFVSCNFGLKQGMRKSASMAACGQEIFLISQEIFKEKQDIKNEAREISKISIKVTNITIRA